MQIVKATQEQIELVKEITHKTINEVYPHYYPGGVVAFFLAHHKTENIKKDIDAGIVYLMMDGERGIGTVTLHGNEICRLFVLPECQHQGLGRQLLDFAEEMIGEKYSEILIDSSLPAKNVYLRRGYVTTETHRIVAENGDVLVYDVMIKKSISKQEFINYDGKQFVPKSNSENGEVDGQTVFRYHQRENVIWAEYIGGEIIQGSLIGTVDETGNLDFTYVHLNKALEIRIGECNSKPIVLEDGRLELHEKWQWLNGDKSKGESVVVEVLLEEVV